MIETPPKFLGAVQDAWFRWVIDLGVPGPDRGEGGKYLIVPPGYDGPLPEGGFFVARARTNTIVWFGRSFLANHADPKPVVETSASSRRSTLTSRVASARQSPNSWPVRLNSGG